MPQIGRMLALVCCIALFALAGCGSSTSSSSSAASGAGGTTTSSTSSIELPTAKFVLHAGLAIGAFHHWIYKPYKAGDFKHPFAHKLTLVKAGLAALFVYHELKIATMDAKASKILQPVVGPLTAAGNRLKQIKTSITDGSVNPADLGGISSQLDHAASTAKAKGSAITEAVPGLAQLAAGGA